MAHVSSILTVEIEFRTVIREKEEKREKRRFFTREWLDSNDMNLIVFFLLLMGVPCYFLFLLYILNFFNASVSEDLFMDFNIPDDLLL